jgi:hypothetical protein
MKTFDSGMRALLQRPVFVTQMGLQADHFVPKIGVEQRPQIMFSSTAGAMEKACINHNPRI